MGVWGHRSESGGPHGGLGLHMEGSGGAYGGVGAPKAGIRGTCGGLGAHMGVWGCTWRGLGAHVGVWGRTWGSGGTHEGLGSHIDPQTPQKSGEEEEEEEKDKKPDPLHQLILHFSRTALTEKRWDPPPNYIKGEVTPPPHPHPPSLGLPH